MRYRRMLPFAALLITGSLMVCAAASAAIPRALICSGGDIPPGTYTSVRVTGVCYAPAGVIIVERNVVVAPGALLDAGTAGDPASDPLLPAQIAIDGGVSVQTGAALVLGCSPATSCPDAASQDSIDGSLTATNALAVVVHSTAVGGNVTISGGGGGTDGGPGSSGCYAVPEPAPWVDDTSISSFPPYVDVEDNVIGGSLTVVGVQTCWIGALRNQVGMSATFDLDQSSDPDGMEFDDNLVNARLACTLNDPAVQFGDSAAASNVAGSASGQCRTTTVLANPSSGGGEENITVPAAGLTASNGTLTEVLTGSTTEGDLQSGATVLDETSADTFAGAGLTGGSSGSSLVTVNPDSSQSFVTTETCGECTFDGVTGSATIELYGTTTTAGVTSGTYLVTSGGLGFGGLENLAGYGTFSSAGQPAGTLGLNENLALPESLG